MTEQELGLEGVRLGLSVVAFMGACLALGSSIMADWRQKLYATRNELWDAMQREGQLDHPAYRELRDGINGLIRLAPAIGLLHTVANLAVVWRATRGRMDHPVPDREVPPLTATADLALLRASDRVTQLLAQRIFLETVPGCLLGWPCWLIWTLWRTIRPTASNVRPDDRSEMRDLVSGLTERVEHQAAASERRRKAVTA